MTHRDNAMHRPRRAIGRSHVALRTAPRAVRAVRPAHPVAHRHAGIVQVPPGEHDERRFIARSLARAAKALRSPYLGNIGVLILLCVMTFHPCFDLAKIVSNSVLCLGAKAAFAATVNLAVNDWTPTIQAFLAGRLLRWIALSLLVALLPALTVIRAGMRPKLRSLAGLVLARLRSVLRASPRLVRMRLPKGRAAGAVHEKVNGRQRHESRKLHSV